MTCGGEICDEVTCCGEICDEEIFDGEHGVLYDCVICDGSETAFCGSCDLEICDCGVCDRRKGYSNQVHSHASFKIYFLFKLGVKFRIAKFAKQRTDKEKLITKRGNFLLKRLKVTNGFFHESISLTLHHLFLFLLRIIIRNLLFPKKFPPSM